MLTLIEQIEHTVLSMRPKNAARFINFSPPWAVDKIRGARFRRTLRLAAERSSFYREQFKLRGIDVSKVEHPSQLGDFYTTGEDLRAHGADAFWVLPPETIGRRSLVGRLAVLEMTCICVPCARNG